MIVFDEVHAAFFVGVEAEVWCGVGDGPDFDGAVEAGGSKSISVLRIDGDIHNVVGVTLEDLEVGQPLSRQSLIVKRVLKMNSAIVPCDPTSIIAPYSISRG